MEILLQQNLQNLHQFWLSLGAQKKRNEFFHRHWPNKHWRQDFTMFAPIAELQTANLVTIQMVEKLPSRLGIKSRLVIMSLANLKDYQVGAFGRGNYHWLDKRSELVDWVESCGQAFGYEVDLNAISQLMDKPDVYVLASYTGGRISGTAIGFRTGNTFGIHQLGVLPEFRGQGIAKNLMKALLLKAKELKCSNISLQASEAGLPLYKNLGFEPLGTLTSLRRT